MPTEIAVRPPRAGKPWPGQRLVHLLAMMAAVGSVALAKRMVDVAKRLDPDL